MKAMLKKGQGRPNPDVGGLGPGTDGDRSGGRPGGLRRAGAWLSVVWVWAWACVLMPVLLLLLLLRWRGSPLGDDRVGGGNVGSRLSQRERGSRRPDESASDGGRKCDQPAGFG